jgi:hypothetical protein
MLRSNAEYDPIGLFERNSCFRVNIQIFSKNWGFYTPKMAQKFVYPESGLEKFFHASKMRAIDSPTRKTLVGSKMSSKIDYNQISTV